MAGREVWDGRKQEREMCDSGCGDQKRESEPLKWSYRGWEPNAGRLEDHQAHLTAQPFLQSLNFFFIANKINQKKKRKKEKKYLRPLGQKMHTYAANETQSLMHARQMLLLIKISS